MRHGQGSGDERATGGGDPFHFGRDDPSAGLTVGRPLKQQALCPTRSGKAELAEIPHCGRSSSNGLWSASGTLSKGTCDGGQRAAEAGTEPMLYKCANEACAVPFRRLREGKLFQVETEYYGQEAAPAGQLSRRTRPWRRIEHYWLCDACSAFVTLTFDRERGVVTVPLPNGTGKRTVTLISHQDCNDEPLRTNIQEVRK